MNTSPSARKELLDAKLGNDINVDAWLLERIAVAPLRTVADEATAIAGMPISYGSIKTWTDQLKEQAA